MASVHDLGIEKEPPQRTEDSGYNRHGMGRGSEVRPVFVWPWFASRQESYPQGSR